MYIHGYLHKCIFTYINVCVCIYRVVANVIPILKDPLAYFVIPLLGAL